MKIKFQADEDLNENIVNAVIRIEPKIDFQTAIKANLKGFTDQQVLELAANQKRILVSHDHRTIPTHFGRFITHSTSYGVLIISKNLSVIETAKNLVLIWAVFSSHEWINRIAYLPL
jgi:hypothetical protein